MYLPEGSECAELFSESSCRIGVGNSHKTLDVGLNVGSLSLFEKEKADTSVLNVRSEE
jgi:hypothetical protein